MPRRLAALAALLPLTSACASSYIPRPGPRVALVMDGGSYAYVRDGVKYEGGLLGGDIQEAVRGNPQAEHYAHAYKTGMTTGWAVTLVGLAGVVGGAVLEGEEASQQNDRSWAAPGLIVMGSGLLVEIVGAIIAANAAPHLFDAINAYNDALPASAPEPAPTAPPPSAATPGE